MLKRVTRGEKLNIPCVLLLGGFDGIHLGHRTLVDCAKTFGYPVGLTSMAGGKRGGDIFTFGEREVVYEKLGLSFVYELEFTPDFMRTSAEDFIKELTAAFDLHGVVCGSDFRFGKDALGTPALLKERLTCPVTVCELKEIGGEKVSSRNVKKLLSEGDVSAANALLCEPYLIMGRVEEGRKVGRDLGFPTVNVSYPVQKFPLREGVYGGYVRTEKGTFPAIVNFGARPTFGVEERKVEAYLDGFSGNLYGTQVQIFPTEYYRPVVKFARVEDLKEQLAKDIERLRT